MGHPPGLYILFFTEMWERFSYYGMRALLLLYMVQAQHVPTQAAGAIYGAYTAAAYITPVPGGYLADRFFGQQRCILAGATLMAAGHFLLLYPSLPAFACALTLLVLGNGLFKPNISVLVGRLYPPEDPRREGAFSLFYMGINLGAFLSPLVCGTLGQSVGWHWGFGAAGVGMLAGLGLFAWGRRRYLGVHGLYPAAAAPAQAGDATAAPTPDAAPKTAAKSPAADGVLTRVQKQRLAVLAVLAILGNVVFWAAFEQAGSSLALFAEQATDRHLGLSTWQIPSSWFQAANPLYIALLSPLFSKLWLRLGQRHREPSTPAKFALGLVFLACGFCVMVRAGHHVDAGLRVGMGWLVWAYFFNTCGELCISPVGLSAVTRLAPPRLMSLAMGLWLGSMAVGNWVAGDYASHYDAAAKAGFFGLPAATAALAAVAMAALVRPLRRMMHGVR